MKPANKAAQKVIETLTRDLDAENTARKIDNAPGAFMAVAVDRLFECEAGTVFAIAHNFEQNGDLVPAPDVEVLISKVDGRAYPLAIQHSTGHYLRVAWIEDGKISKFIPRGQRDLATFVGSWMKNIKRQQEI